MDEEGIVPDFNPINYLAQQLMRLNPRPITSSGLLVQPANTAGASYVQSLNEVVVQLREMRVLGEQTARLKDQLLQQNLDREKEESYKKIEGERRHKVLLETALVWGREIPALQVVHVVHSWLEDVDCHPQAHAFKVCFQRFLTRSISRTTTWTDEDFVEVLSPSCIDLPLDAFTLFANHLKACGEERQRAQQREQRRSLLKEVFMSCNPNSANTLDRQHILQLFMLYYDHAPAEMKLTLTSPYTWPASGLTEDSKEEELEWTEKSNEVTEEDYREFLSSSFSHSPTPPREEESLQGQLSQVVDRKGLSDQVQAGENGTADSQLHQENNGAPVTKENSQSLTEEVTAVEKEPPHQPRQLLDSEREVNDAEAEVQDVGEDSLVAKKEGEMMTQGQRLAEADSVPTSLSHDSSIGWSPKHVTLPQFLQLCDLLIGDHPDSNVVTSLATFLKENYGPGRYHDAESHASRMQNQHQWRQHCQQKLSAVFSLWDVTFSGFVSGQELQKVLREWNGFQKDISAVESALASGSVGNKVSKMHFVGVLADLSQPMSNEEFKAFTDFLTASIQLSHEQKQRGQLRLELMSAIKKAGQRATFNLAPVLEAAGTAVQQDTIQFGGGKRVSVCVAMLVCVSGSEGYCLHYQFATDDISAKVLGRKLSRKTVPVSFTAIDSAQVVHISNVHKCKKVHFFIPEHKDEMEYQGELAVVPIIVPPGMVVGVISVDTVASIGRSNLPLTPSEIAFYQAVADCLGEVLLVTSARRKLIAASEAGIAWLQRRCTYLLHTDFYINKPREDEEGCVLQRCLSADKGPSGKIAHCSDELRKEDNLFREYLFDCAENKESVSAEAYCHPHLACPIRDLQGNAVAILDFTLSKQASQIPAQHSRDIAKMVKLLTTAFCQLSHVAAAKEDQVIPMSLDEGEGSVGVLFHKLLLVDLQRSMANLNNRAFAELRSYTDPPSVVQQTVQALVLTLYPQATNWEQWTTCKQYVTLTMLRALEKYSPSSQEPHPCLEKILARLRGISPTEVFHQGSLPTHYLFTWVSAACAVLEHISIMSNRSLAAETVESRKSLSQEDEQAWKGNQQ